MRYLENGIKVIARPGSKTGGATLEIVFLKGKPYKIRYQRGDNMEKWNEVFKEKIPEGLYEVELSFWEKMV